MDEGLFQDVPEARLRRIFGRSCGPSNPRLTEATAATASSVSNNTGSNKHLQATPLEAASTDRIDPLFPSLDEELPQVRRPAQTLRRPAWDPRERWRQLRPSQPYYAPPESDLPAQFRHEDLSVYENSETMDIHEDRLLRWLHEQFEKGLQYKSTSEAAAGDADFLQLAGEQVIKQQVFTELQILDEQLSNLGLDSSNPVLIERRRQLLLEQQQKRQQAPPTPSELASSGPTTSRSSSQSTATVSAAATAAAAASSSSKLSPLDELNVEFENDDFGAFVSPSVACGGTQTTQTVVTVHEAAWQQRPLEPESAIPHRRKHRHSTVNFAAGDEATGSSGGGGGGGGSGGAIECEVDIRPNCERPAVRAAAAAGGGFGHRVQQFGDAASFDSGEFVSKKPAGRRNVAEESV